MSRIYIFRGKAASGKSALANRLGEELKIPVFGKDDVLEPIKECDAIEDRGLRNEVCYRVVERMTQRCIDNGCDVILDIGLGHREAADYFLHQIDLGDSKVISFFAECEDVDVWRQRHENRIANPRLSQSFKSFEHVLTHYEKFDLSLLENEYKIDSSLPVDVTMKTIKEVVYENPVSLVIA